MHEKGKIGSLRVIWGGAARVPIGPKMGIKYPLGSAKIQRRKTGQIVPIIGYFRPNSRKICRRR